MHSLGFTPHPAPPTPFPWPSSPKSSATCGTRLRFIISFQGLGEQPLHPPLHKSGAESGSDDKLTEDAWTPAGWSFLAPEAGCWSFCIIPRRERGWEREDQRGDMRAASCSIPTPCPAPCLPRPGLWDPRLNPKEPHGARLCDGQERPASGGGHPASK